MLNTSLSLIITFSTTTGAMAAERHFNSKGLEGRLIPVPKKITAGCGLAWKASPEVQTQLCESLDSANIAWQDTHIIEV